VTLVLVDSSGVVLGALPPFHVPTRWRQEAAEVVQGAREHHGIGVTVLRLLSAEDPPSGERAGGTVTYLAEHTADAEDAGRDGLLGLDAVPTAVLRPDPRRPSYAEPGGPAASLAWATGVLGPVHAEQLRTWNLSSIWRLRHAGGTAWLKEVPAFFRHEGALLGWLASTFPGLAPTPLAVGDTASPDLAMSTRAAGDTASPTAVGDTPGPTAGGVRMLLADVPGEDRYKSLAPERVSMLRDLHRVQYRAATALPELHALGVPDRRSPILAAKIHATVTRHGDPALLAGLDERLAAIAACGMPDTLVHGDFHPGNVRGSVILDWGDSFIGHPGFDLYRMIEWLPREEAPPLIAEWCAWWRAAVPGCAPERAITLLEPVCALRNAMIYADFLDQIEPSEHSYHAHDVPDALDQAAELLLLTPRR
jgi:hypothetical protein